VAAWEYPAALGWSVVPDWDPAADTEKMLQETVAEVFGGEPAAGLELQVHEGVRPRSSSTPAQARSCWLWAAAVMAVSPGQMGGLSASYGKQGLARYPFVDFALRGDNE
jgi:hypothetical protein